MAAPVAQISFILVDPNFQHTIESLFRVEVPPNGDFLDLMVKIKEWNQNTLAHVDADNLEVWKLRNPRTVREVKRTEYLRNLRRLDDVPRNADEGDEETAWLVWEIEEILSHLSRLPKNKISALVRIPVPLQLGGSFGRECSTHLLA